MHKKLLFFLFVSVAFNSYSQNATLLPSKFVDGARFYLRVPTVKGDTLLGYCDTGGGFTAIMPKTVQRIGLDGQTQTMNLNGQEISYLNYADVVSDPDFPVVEVPFFSPVKTPVFFIPPPQIVEKQFANGAHFDLFLAQHFFMGKAWTFDYPNQQVFVNSPISETTNNKKNIQPLGFKKDEEGNMIFGHPRFKVIIDGDTLDMLFDTGATFVLTDSSKTGMKSTSETMAGSFIARSVFDQWRLKHPEWKIQEKADNGADIIEVPSITIGSYTVGPVYFSVRPDEAWSQFMAGSMDKVVKGAIGGTVLKYFTVKIDYNKELVEFSR